MYLVTFFLMPSSDQEIARMKHSKGLFKYQFTLLVIAATINGAALRLHTLKKVGIDIGEWSLWICCGICNWAYCDNLVVVEEAAKVLETEVLPLFILKSSRYGVYLSPHYHIGICLLATPYSWVLS